MDKKIKIAGTIGGIALLGIGMLGGATLFPVEKEVQVPVEVIKTVEVPVIETVTETEFVNVPVEVEKIVEVDNGNLDLVMQYIEDNYDDEITVDDIVFETEAKMEAETFIRENMISLLDDNDFFDDGEALDQYRKSEVSIKKIADAVVLDRDFDEKDMTLEFAVKIRAREGSDDAEYFDFTVVVPFEEGKLIDEDIEVKY